MSQTPSWTLVDDKGTWTVRIRMTDERTGKVKQKARTTGLKVKDGTKRAAKKVAERIADELYEQFLAEQDALDNQRFIYFKEYVEAWLDTREMNVRPNTLKSYQDYADVHIIPKLGNYRVEEITWRILQEFADRLLKSHSRNTVKKFFIVIRGVLDDAVRDGVILSNPALLVRLPKGEKADVSTALTKNEAYLFLTLSESAGEPLRAAIMLGLCYGLRRSEVCGLRWIDINFKDGTMHIQHTVTQNGTVLLDDDHTKTQKSNRVLSLIPSTIPYLKQLRVNQIKSGLVLDKVVAWPDGRIVRPDGITRMFNTFIKSKGLRKIRFHDLRHTAATLLVDAGLPPKKLQSFLGHDDIDMSLKLYTHVVDEVAKDASRRMDQIINSGICSGFCSGSGFEGYLEKTQNS